MMKGIIKPLLFSAFFMCNQFHCDAKPSKLQIRAKRDFLLPGSSGQQPCGCLSKYAPINCRCTSASGNSDELLCRCDRALVSPTNREDSNGNGNREMAMPAQCGANCRMAPTGDPNLFRQGAQQRQQHNYGGNYGGYGGGGPMPPMHSACHPICHKSCTQSCTSSRPTTPMVDPSINFGGGGISLPSPADMPQHAAHHQQHNQPMRMDSKGIASSSNCIPSQCRANCLRACARIFDGQQRQQQQIRENFVSANGIENDNNDIVEPNYQVEMGGQPKQSPDYGMGRNGCQCSPSQTNICECQGSCYPICVDTCESNCLQQQMQQTPANQRAQCAQFCHLECQHDCALDEQQRMPTRKGVETMESIDKSGTNNNNNNENIINWPSTNNGMMTNNAGGSQINGGNPIAICAHKCPRACEQACQSAQNGEPNSNCVPTCIGLCAQSCARGIQFDAVGLTQQMAVPMPAMATVDFAVAGTAQAQNISNFNGGGEFEQKQHHHQQQMNDWGGGGGMAAPTFGQNDGPSVEFGNEAPPPTPQLSTTAMVPAPLMEDAGQQEQAVPATPSRPTTTTGQEAGGGPCAPLCQPECRPECTKRYMEERNGNDRSQQQQQLQYGQMITMNNNNKNARENGGKSNVGEEQQQQTTKQQRSASSSSSAFFPPHIILDEGLITASAAAYNDDESNVTAKGQNLQDNLQLDKMSWLRTQNETGGRDKWNGAELYYHQQNDHTKDTKVVGVLEKQAKSKDQSAGQRHHKVPNATVKGEKQHHHHNHHHHHTHHDQQQHHQLGKDGGKLRGGRANELFFRRRKLQQFGEESKVPKKVPKNNNGKEADKTNPSKTDKKREKSGENAKGQNVNAKKWQ